MHDGFGTYDMKSRNVVAKALDVLIPKLNNEGYEIVAFEGYVNQMLFLFSPKIQLNPVQ